MFLYVFAIPSFSGRGNLKFVTYIFMILLSISVVAFFLLFKGIYIRKELSIIPLFTAFALIGTLIYSKEHRGYFTLVLLCLSFLIVYGAICIINNSNVSISIIVFALSLFCGYFIFYFRSSFLNFANFNSESFRLGYPFDNPNGIASVSAVGFAVSLYAFVFFKPKWKYVFIVSILLHILVGISTGSRTFIIMVAIITLVMLFFRFQKHKWIYIIIVACLIGLFAILINLPFLSTIKERFIRAINTFIGGSSSVDTSSISRITWLNYGFFLGNKSLIVGYGYGGFGKYSGVGTYAHSNFSEVFCDFGIVGLLLFYYPLFFCLHKSLKYKNGSLGFIFTIVVYYLVAGLANVFFYNKIYYIVLALLYSFIFNSKNQNINSLRTIKNIVFTCDRLGFGGAEKVIASISNYFATKNIKVTIVGISDHNQAPVYDLLNGVKYITTDNNKNRLLRLLELRRTIKDIKPDAIVSFLPHVNIYTYFSTIGLKIPLVVSERNNPSRDPKNLLIRFLKYYVFCNSDGVIFQTKQAMDYYPDWFKHKSVVIKNPLDDKLPYSDTSTKEKTVLYVGRLVKQKNVYCLIRAFDDFHKKHPDFTLKIYGAGDMKEDLERFSNSFGLSRIVNFVGNNQHWHDLEKNSAIFVLPSDFEGFPNSLMEALAVGIPCVSTDSPCGGSRELISDGVNGFLCNIDDYIDMSSKMESAIGMKITNEQINSFRSEYSIDFIGNKWIDFLTRL